jgi:hypothetical protein
LQCLNLQDICAFERSGSSTRDIGKNAREAIGSEDHVTLVNVVPEQGGQSIKGASHAQILASLDREDEYYGCISFIWMTLAPWSFLIGSPFELADTANQYS